MSQRPYYQDRTQCLPFQLLLQKPHSFQRTVKEQKRIIQEDDDDNEDGLASDDSLESSSSLNATTALPIKKRPRLKKIAPKVLPNSQSSSLSDLELLRTRITTQKKMK